MKKSNSGAATLLIAGSAILLVTVSLTADLAQRSLHMRSFKAMLSGKKKPPGLFVRLDRDCYYEFGPAIRREVVLSLTKIARDSGRSINEIFSPAELHRALMEGYDDPYGQLQAADQLCDDLHVTNGFFFFLNRPLRR